MAPFSVGVNISDLSRNWRRRKRTGNSRCYSHGDVTSTPRARKKYGYLQVPILFTDYLRSHDLLALLRHEPARTRACDAIDIVGQTIGNVAGPILFVAVAYFWR